MNRFPPPSLGLHRRRWWHLLLTVRGSALNGISSLTGLPLRRSINAHRLTASKKVRHKNSPYSFLIPLLILTLSNGIQADQSLVEGLVQAEGFGTVDTSKTKNRVQAKLMAKRAAVVDAQRNLLEMIEGVRITSGTTVKDAQLESDIVANRIKGFLKGAFILKQNLSEEDDVYLAEVTLAVCLNTAIQDCEARPTLAQIVYDSIPETPAENRYEAQADASVPTATSLIVNLADFDIETQFDTRLISNDGKEVYGPGHFKPATGRDWLHWATSMEEARRLSISGTSPLVLPASRVEPDSKIVLSDQDAQRLYAANLNSGNFLEQGKVIFVIAPTDKSQ